MNTFPILLGALCVYAIGYRFYSAFIAAKALSLDDRRTTPGHLYADGHNYVASPRWVLFGHHFAAIAGAGPLVGPTLAAQFGFAPGFLWILIGAVAGRLRSGLHRARRLRASPRTLPGGYRAHRDQSFRRPGSDDCRSLHSAGDARGLGHCGGQCAFQQSLGSFHHRHDDPDRSHHGFLDVQKPCRENHRNRPEHFRRSAVDRQCGRRTLGSAERSGGSPDFHAAPDHDYHGSVRPDCFCSSGLAGARAARLSLHLRQARHDCSSRDRRVRRTSQHPVPELHSLCARRRSHH